MPDAPRTVTRPPGQLARRPAVALAVLLTLGILLHARAPHRPLLIIGVAAALAGCAGVTLRRARAASTLLALAVVCCGIGVAQLEHFEYAANDIGLFATDDPRLASVEVRVLDDPQVLTGPPGHGRPWPPKQVFTAAALRIRATAGWTTATGDFPVALNHPIPALHAGQTLRMFGMLQRPRPATNPGEFDWAAYYRSQRVLSTFTVNRSGNVQVLADGAPSPLVWLRIRVRHLLARGFTHAHVVDGALLQALVLGDRDSQLQDVQEEFQQSGLAYQLSVSGLHLAILSGGVLWTCRGARLRPRWSLGITTGFIALYGLVSLPSHSGVRAVIISLLLAVGWYARRATDRAQLIAVAALVMLLWHPMDLYSVGFLLSFTVVVAFLLVLPRVWEWVLSLRDPHMIVVADRLRYTPAMRRLRRAGRWALQGLLFGLVAWLSTLPLVAFSFGQVTPWAVPAGLLLLPVVVVALYAGLFKVLLTGVMPFAAHPLAVVAGWPIALMRGGVHLLIQSPGANVPVVAPPVWLIVGYYAAMVVPLLPRPAVLLRHRWPVRALPVAAVAAVFCLPLFRRQALVNASGPELRVTLLSLGAGQCAVVETPDGQTALVDAGSTTVSDVERKVIAPFLRSQGNRQVEEIFLSHGDFDHISAAGEVATDFGTREVFTSHHFRRNAAGNVPALALLDTLAALNLPPHLLASGDRCALGGGAMIDVVWPPPDGEWNSNNAGLVLRLSYAGRTILFPADIQDPAFAALLNHRERLPADVLVAPHPGSSELLTPAFLAAVHPSVILSSNAQRLTGKQKWFNAMVGQTPLYRTSTCGAITVSVGADGRITVGTYNSKAADGVRGLAANGR